MTNNSNEKVNNSTNNSNNSIKNCVKGLTACRVPEVDTPTGAVNTPTGTTNTPTDYISRQAAIRIASGFCHTANVAKELAKLPSVQPEITRCKDCKHRKCFYLTFTVCDEWGGRRIVKDDDFCSRAKRRTDE